MAGSGAPGAGAPTGAGAPRGTGGATGMGGAIGTGGITGTGGAAGTGPGRAIGTPAISESGALGGPHSSPFPCKHSSPRISGAAAASELNAMAIPHKAAPAAKTLMLIRSMTAIDVDSFIRAQTFAIGRCGRTAPVPKSWWTTASIVNGDRDHAHPPDRVVSKW